MKQKRKSVRGITLIALVVTIVVLLILAAVSISMLGGENGIIKQAVDAKDKNEIARIKEEADLVKQNMFIGDYTSNQRISQTVQRKNLIKDLNNYFEGSTAKGNLVITSDKKYDIIVKNDLEILVVKHGDNYLKDGDVELIYYYDDADTTEGVTVNISAMIGGIETYEEFAREKLKGMTNTEKEAMFVEANKYWNYNNIPEEVRNITDFAEYVSAKLGGDENAPKTLDELKDLVNEMNSDNTFETVDDLLMYWEYVAPEEYYGKTYEQYAQEILDNITETGDARTAILEQYYIEAWNYFEFNEQKYTDWTSMMAYWQEKGLTTYDDLPSLAEGKGYSSIEEFLLYDNWWIKPQEYAEYQAQLEKSRKVEIQCSNGNKNYVIIEEYTKFWITENGSYTFTATGPNGETGKVTIEITNIIFKITSVLAERTSEGLRITVNAARASEYEFQIDNGEKVKQTENVYNYNINYSEAKTTSSTIDPYIPRGFVHTEGTVDTGYVVSDLPKDYILTVKATDSKGRKATFTKTIKGSEFVWVPVDKDSSTVYPSLKRGVTGESLNSNYTEDLGSSTDTTSVQYFIDSVNTNGGFYIARYEAGRPGNVSGDVPNLSSTNNITAIPVARENVMPWNWIDLNHAKASSESMYNLNIDGIQSQLINSYAWDTVLNWAIASGEKTREQVITDSTSWGNYGGSSYTFSGNYITATPSSTGGININSTVRNGYNVTKQTNEKIAYLLATGTLKQRNSIKNICDMAGNLGEWSTEKDYAWCITRGWYWIVFSSSFYSHQKASTRGAGIATDPSESIGFRVVLCK